MNSPRNPSGAIGSSICLPPIWLVGLMACGKSSVMRVLMEEQGYKGIDMDTLITERAGMSIAEIFKNEQEAGFRKREQEVLQEIADQKPSNTIISTGGGAPCFFDNMQVMNSSGTTIFLDGDAKLLAQRTLDDEATGKSVRPLVKGMRLFDRITKFHDLDATRRPFYSQSQVTILIGRKSVEEIVEEILGKCS